MNNILKLGKISEEEFVNLFGTEKQKKEWERYDCCLNSSLKKRLLSKAQKYCSIKALCKREFYIGRIYQYPLPLNITKMKRPIYKDLIPLVLLRLIEINECCCFTVGKWMEELKIVNDNYNIVKKQKTKSSSILNVEIKDINDFFKYTEPSINHYFIKSFKYLEEAGYIKYQKILLIKSKSLKNYQLTTKGNFVLEVQSDTHVANEEEIEFYNKCVNSADKKNKIENSTDRYYSSKNHSWKKDLQNELIKKNIISVYEAFQINIIDIEKCQKLIKELGGLLPKTYISRLTKDLKKILLDNAKKRFINNDLLYEKYKESFEKIYSNVMSNHPGKIATKKLTALVSSKKTNIKIIE